MLINVSTSRLVIGRISIVPGAEVPAMAYTEKETAAIDKFTKLGFLGSDMGGLANKLKSVYGSKQDEKEPEDKPKADKQEIKDKKAENKSENKPEAKPEKQEAKPENKPEAKAEPKK